MTVLYLCSETKDYNSYPKNIKTNKPKIRRGATAISKPFTKWSLECLLKNHMSIKPNTTVKIRVSWNEFQGKILHIDNMRNAIILLTDKGKILIPYKKISYIQTVTEE